MTVSTEHIKDIFMGDGINTRFQPTFQVIEKDQIKCLKVLITGEEIEVLNTEFEIRLINGGASGAEITYPLVGNPLEEGSKLIVYRQTEITNNYTPPNGQVFDAAAIRAEVDRLTMQNQEQKEGLGRSVQVSIGSDVDPTKYLDNVNEMLTNARELQEETVAVSTQNIAEATAQVVIATNKASDALESANNAAISAQMVVDVANGFDAHAAEKISEYNQNHDNKSAIIGEQVNVATNEANRAETAANNAEVQEQSVYQGRIVLESPVIVLQERKCRYVRDVLAGDAFTIDKSAIKQLDKDLTFELILKMPTVVAFDLGGITSKWMGGDVPDLSEAGEHWLAFTSQDGGQTWRGSYEGKFAL